MTRPPEVAPPDHSSVPPETGGHGEVRAASVSPAAVARQIITAADLVRARDPRALPIACWDFDGTLLEGDCVDGYRRGDGAGYRGLVERAIRSGLCPAYAGAEGAARCERDFRAVRERDGRAAAYAFQSLIFARAAESPLRALARTVFAEELDAWIFANARACWQELDAHGIECWILSASPEFFVGAAAESLGVPASRGLGMRLARRDDGRLGDRLDGPVMFGEGKVARLQSLLDHPAATDAGQVRIPVAAFGNDRESDGPMLAAVTRTRLPAGRPLGVYVNVDPADAAPDAVRVRFHPRPAPGGLNHGGHTHGKHETPGK